VFRDLLCGRAAQKNGPKNKKWMKRHLGLILGEGTIQINKRLTT